MSTAAIVMQLPCRIIAADWSKAAAKRRMARAERTAAGGLQIFPAEPVDNVATLFERAKTGVAADGTVLMGFDFPIGLPHAYAAQLGFASFRAALPQFGQPPFTDFYGIGSQPDLHRPFYPPPARRKGLYTRHALAEALHVAHFNDLLRLCDRTTRPPAGCMFFTVGGQQPGPGMIIGWREVLAPALADIRIWPFDGPLDVLLRQPGLVISEVYPAEACRQLGLLPGRRWSKRRLADRQVAAARLLWRWQGNNRVEWSAAAYAQLQGGCATEDDFDALVALAFMIDVALGRIPCPAPDEAPIQAIEGWILGLPLPPSLPAG